MSKDRRYMTQGGGAAAFDENGNLVFIEKPECPGLDVGEASNQGEVR